MIAKTLGPKTLALLLRSLGIYIIIFVMGLVLSTYAQSLVLKAFGLGLIFPGGGFALWCVGDGWHFAIHVALAFLCFAAFLFAILLWFATGNALAPPIVWLATAFAASLMQHDEIWQNAVIAVPLLAMITLAIVIAAFFIRSILGAKILEQQPAQLALESANLQISRDLPAKNELSFEDLQLIRTLYDRAFQPLDQFQGFNHLDQFQTAALRYQLNLAGYALAMFQHNHAPAFRGYLYEAQQNLVLKNLDHRIWKFWERENLWGNLDRNPDPCGRDNIMFTGFLAAQIAMFHAASGETPFNQSGSLSFIHPSGKVFKHDTGTLVKSLFDNYQSAPLGLMACEPNWVYPLCNTIGAAALKHFAPVEWQTLSSNFSHALDTEFRDPSGQFVPCRSSYTGFALPTIGGAVGQVFPCFFLNATLPDVAEKHWLATRSKMLRHGVLNKKHFWPVDVGNYGFSRASSLSASAAAANEMGDTEMADALLHQLEIECPSTLLSGVRHRVASSFWAHSAEILARSTIRNSFHSMMASKMKSGPQIDGLSYPDVLVARAHFTETGLKAILYGNGTHKVGFINLQPLQSYHILGSNDVLSADALGTARFEFPLHGRTMIHIEKRV